MSICFRLWIHSYSPKWVSNIPDHPNSRCKDAKRNIRRANSSSRFYSKGILTFLKPSKLQSKSWSKFLQSGFHPVFQLQRSLRFPILCRGLLGFLLVKDISMMTNEYVVTLVVKGNDLSPLELGVVGKQAAMECGV